MTHTFNLHPLQQTNVNFQSEFVCNFNELGQRVILSSPKEFRNSSFRNTKPFREFGLRDIQVTQSLSKLYRDIKLQQVGPVLGALPGSSKQFRPTIFHISS